MEAVLDLTKEYGLVLEGGGARGAYQIGAWRALTESRSRRTNASTVRLQRAAVGAARTTTRTRAATTNAQRISA